MRLAAALGLAAAPALAQAPDGLPRDGRATLAESFEPDPPIFDLRGENCGVADCGGFVSDGATFDLTYDTSGARDLYIYAVSSKDTVLLVRLPDGSWVCDDDSYGGGDPLLRIPGAPGSLYAIWVGTHDGSEPYVRLQISEFSPF